MYEKGNYANAYTEVPASNPGNAWRDGMVSGNGENGYITSGSPYTDSFIFQYMWFNYPSRDPRVIPEELTEQLADARRNVFKQNDQWKITFPRRYHEDQNLLLQLSSRTPTPIQRDNTEEPYLVMRDGRIMKQRRPGYVTPMKWRVDPNFIYVQRRQCFDYEDRTIFCRYKD